MPFVPSLFRLLRALRSALCLWPTRTLGLAENTLVLFVHAVGLTALARYLQLDARSIVVVIAALVLFQLALLRTRRISTAWLTPFFFVYAIFAIRFVFIRVLHGTTGGYFDFNLTEWGLPFLDVEAATVAASLYSALILACAFLESRRRAVLVFTTALAVLTLVWASAEYFGHRTSGATGSDPYAYVQMGVDLATRGTFVHRFDLFPEIAPLKIAWYPVVPVGYHLPMNLAGDAVTVWPPGGSVAYALAYRLGGEAAFYWINPLFSLLAALMASLLGWELTRRDTTARRLAIAVLAGVVVATANEQVVWAGVTMVDAQAEFFSAAAVFFALRAHTNPARAYPLLAGAALGAAYDVRLTQLVLALSLLIVLLPNRRAILWSGLAALFVALPDLWYHQLYLGGWLHPESEELALFSIASVADTANNLYQRAFAANEFGWLAPFLLYGGVQLARRARIESWALVAWVGLSLALHLPYPALRLRDLLPEFPALAFVAAYGAVILIAQLLQSPRSWLRLAASLVVFAALELFILRVWNTIPRVGEPTQPNFGYVTEAQRAAFSQLAMLTPTDAVIGATLNAGAIALYSRRDTFRPDGWNPAELREFLQTVRMKHSSVYILEDGGVIDKVLDDLHDFKVQRVATLDVPLFGDGPVPQPGALWRIEK
jgi:Dolichyl-phosphate-mannose-protein mannosyltransferase